jgi:hypothetical protein
MRRSKKGGSVYTRIGVWRDKHGAFHMTLEGVKGGHVAVTADPSKRNGHPALFEKLTRLFEDETLRAAQRPREIQVKFVARDGTVTNGAVFKLPDTI